MGKRPANVYLSKNLNRPKSFIIKQAMTVSKKYLFIKIETLLSTKNGQG